MELDDVSGEQTFIKAVLDSKTYETFTREVKQVAEATSHEDLQPTPQHLRTWGWTPFAAMWVVLALCIPSYAMGTGLLVIGLNWWQATLACALGNLFTVLPLTLNGFIGAKYGIAYPVLLRSSFGLYGARFAALPRGFIAVGWYAINTWIASQAIYAVFMQLRGIEHSNFVLSLGDWMGITVGELASLLLFTAINIAFVYKGIESMKWLQVFCAPILIIAAIALFIWACLEVGLVKMLAATEATSGYTDNKTATFFMGLTSVVGVWSTMALNMLDFTRYAKSQFAQGFGQLIGFPFAMTAVAFLGIAVTGATIELYGYPIWDLPELFSHWNVLIILLANGLVILSTLASNFTANMVSPANDFSNLWPEKISFRMAGYFTCILGLCVFPWKLYTASNFIEVWLLGYSPIMAAMGGIMLADFYIIQKRSLDLNSLYDHSSYSKYWFIKGFNWRAFLALFLGYAPCCPGFLEAIGVIPYLPIWIRSFYDYSWFIAFFLGALFYSLLMMRYYPAQTVDREEYTEIPDEPTNEKTSLLS